MKTNNAHLFNSNEGSLLEILRDTYLERKSRRPSYSLSSFARDLDISKTTLSRILSQERGISLKLAMHLSAALELSSDESKKALLCVLKSDAKISKKLKYKLKADIEKTIPKIQQHDSVILEVERFKTMNNWYHLAILNLIRIESVNWDAISIANTLGIHTVEVRDAINRLIGLGLMSEEEGKFKRTRMNFFFKTSKSDLSIRRFHSQMIDKAQEELKDNSQERFEKRLINGMTFVCAKEHIPLIKAKMDQLQEEILALAASAPASELCQFNMQFFPLTRKTNN